MGLTIIGDRQEGKTHLLLDIAARDIRDGKTVVFMGHNHATERDAMERFLEIHIAPAECAQARWSRGNWQVCHVSGGVVHFAPSRVPGSVDTFLLDDGAVYRDPEIVFPSARVYRTAR